MLRLSLKEERISTNIMNMTKDLIFFLYKDFVPGLHCLSVPDTRDVYIKRNHHILITLDEGTFLLLEFLERLHVR